VKSIIENYFLFKNRIREKSFKFVAEKLEFKRLDICFNKVPVQKSKILNR